MRKRVRERGVGARVREESKDVSMCGGRASRSLRNDKAADAPTTHTSNSGCEWTSGSAQQLNSSVQSVPKYIRFCFCRMPFYRIWQRLMADG